MIGRYRGERPDSVSVRNKSTGQAHVQSSSRTSWSSWSNYTKLTSPLFNLLPFLPPSQVLFSVSVSQGTSPKRSQANFCRTRLVKQGPVLSQATHWLKRQNNPKTQVLQKNGSWSKWQHLFAGSTGAVMFGPIMDRWVQLMKNVVSRATITGRCSSIRQVKKEWKNLACFKLQEICQCGWSTEWGNRGDRKCQIWCSENR